jgi:hypothetical protein
VAWQAVSPFYLLGQLVKRFRLGHFVTADLHLETARAEVLFVEANNHRLTSACYPIADAEQLVQVACVFTDFSEHVKHPLHPGVECIID